MWKKLMQLVIKWMALIILVVIIGGWLGISNLIKRSGERKACEHLSQLADSAFAQGNYFDAEKYYYDLVYGKRDLYFRCPNRPRSSSGISVDDLVFGELQEYNRAARDKEIGNYYGAIFTLQRNLRYPGELNEAEELLLKEIYELLILDTGETGKQLMLDMHENLCGNGTNDIPPYKEIIKPGSTLKYWYPGADSSTSTDVAEFPAEFQLAVCSEVIDTDLVETCVYTSTGSFGATGLSSSTVRKSATYEIKLLNILSGETIAKYQPVFSKPPGGCPDSMPASSLFTEIIGEPDYLTAQSWLNEQIELIK